MEMYDRSKLNHRLNELNEEETNLEKYLFENSNSLSTEEIKRVENNLVGVRSEKGQISHLVAGGFY
jgi:hypothetical protein